jgi:hypothetical protein
VEGETRGRGEQWGERLEGGETSGERETRGRGEQLVQGHQRETSGYRETRGDSS